jgi:membrane protein implicated in regulation of membrane protease activity
MTVNGLDDSPPKPAPPDGTPDTDQAGPASARRLQRQLEELDEFARYYLAARLDAILASVRRTAMSLLAAILAVLILAACLVTCAVIVILGLAELVGRMLGDSPGAGYLVTGFGLLIISALALVIVMALVQRSSRERTARKYAQRRHEQKTRFGHDVAEQAEAQRQAPRD